MVALTPRPDPANQRTVASSERPISGLRLKLARGAAAAMGVLAAGLSGCADQPGLENPDLAISQGVRRWHQDRFEPLPGAGTISSSFRYSGGEQAVTGPFAQAHNRNITPAAIRLADWTVRDTGRTDEEFNITGPNGEEIFRSRQIELNTGFLLQAHEEGLSATFRGQPVLQMTEREAACEREEKETINFVDGARVESRAEIIERGNGLSAACFSRETNRAGTTINISEGGTVQNIRTEVFVNGLLGSTWGSRVSLNGQAVYSVDWRAARNFPVSRNLGGGYALTTPSGREFASVRLDTTMTRYQNAFAVHHEGRYLGTMYLEQSQVDSSCSGFGDDRKCDSKDIRRILHVRLAGETPEAKLESLRQIDRVLALMPDQVNQNLYGLEFIEEALDVGLMALVAQGKANADDEIRRLAAAVSTEEDPFTMLEAIRTLVPGENRS